MRRNPFARVRAFPCACEHGVCWCEECARATDDGIVCRACFGEDVAPGEGLE